MRSFSPALAFFVLCGAVAGWFVAGVVPAGLRQPFLRTQDYRVVRKVEDPLVVTPSRWMFEPSLFGDFDLQMDVELAPDTDLDVLVRQVEPRLVDEHVLPFAGRFTVLRLSTGKEGPGWRTRDEALLAPRQGGVGLAAGYAATVWIEGRGCFLTANVAGKPQGSTLATDTYGMFTLIAHGGQAVVRNLTITPRGQRDAWLWSRWPWVTAGALGALLLGLLGRRVGFAVPWFVVTPLPLPLLAWLAAGRADLDLAFPPPTAMLMLLAGCLCASASRLVRGPLWPLPVAAAVGLLVGGDGRLRHDTRAIDGLFGPDAGAQISEAHGRLVRGPGGLHDLGEPGKRVFLLGGQLLYDRGQPAEHLELLLGRELRAATRQRVAVPCLPTVDGHTAQQWRLFETCFTGYRPAVLVLGIPRDEMAIDPATGAPRSAPDPLRATIAAARAWCEANGSKLLVFGDRALPDVLQAVVREVASGGVTVVSDVDGAAPVDVAKRLAAAIVPLLTP